MHRLRYHITTQAPVIISAFSGDRNMVRTEQHIRGATVLGLLAKRIINEKALDENAHQDNDFYAWFLRGKLQIGNAYIISRDEYGEYQHFPTPFSIEREKHGTAVYDSLFRETDETKYIGDYCQLDADSIQIQPVETRIEFHHKRKRETGVSEKGLIFNYESIAPEQTFEGEIRGLKSDLELLLKYTSNQWTASLGRSRNAQYGTVEFQFLNNEPEEIPAPAINNDQQISMTLLSDLILYNEFGFPTVDVDDLEQELQKLLGKLQIKEAFVKKNQVENFIGVWRLKKPSESCFKAGSAFLLKLDSVNTDKLKALQESGLGERRHEGFGRMVFGRQTHADLSLMEEAKPPITKPDFSPPQTIQDIVKSIIEKLLIERIKLQAANKQTEFVRLPSNSLIARLYSLADKCEGNQDGLSAKIKEFRKIAADQMRHSLSRDHNLMEFLEKENPIEEFFRQLREKSIKKLCLEMEYLPESDDSLKQKLLHAYYTTFFSMMRKRKIAEEKHNVRT